MPIEFKLTDLDELERDKAMKMKKWLTGLMAVALMWAGIAYADECTHETTRTYSYPNAITYTSILFGWTCCNNGTREGKIQF